MDEDFIFSCKVCPGERVTQFSVAVSDIFSYTWAEQETHIRSNSVSYGKVSDVSAVMLRFWMLVLEIEQIPVLQLQPSSTWKVATDDIFVDIRIVIGFFELRYCEQHPGIVVLQSTR